MSSRIAAVSLACVAVSAGAFECTGTACNDVVFRWDGNCYQTTNLGTQRIKVTQGPYTFTLQRGETHTLQIGSTCLHSYIGDNSANYASPQVAAPTRPPETPKPRSNPPQPTPAGPPPPPTEPARAPTMHDFDWTKPSSGGGDSIAHAFNDPVLGVYQIIWFAGLAGALGDDIAQMETEYFYFSNQTVILSGVPGVPSFSYNRKNIKYDYYCKDKKVGVKQITVLDQLSSQVTIPTPSVDKPHKPRTGSDEDKAMKFICHKWLPQFD